MTIATKTPVAGRQIVADLIVGTVYGWNTQLGERNYVRFDTHPTVAPRTLGSQFPLFLGITLVLDGFAAPRTF